MTEIALREFLEAKICALDKRIDERFIALEKANKLQSENRRDNSATWLASIALLLWAVTVILMLFKPPGAI